MLCPTQAFLSSGEFEARGISTLLHSCVVLGYINPLLGWAAAEAAAAPGVMGSMAPQVGGARGVERHGGGGVRKCRRMGLVW